MSENNLNIEYEMSPTSQKGKVVLPNEGSNDLLKATARLINVISSGAEGVGKMLKNSTNVIGKPIEALIQGKTNEIELANQFITARLMYVKEANATMHLSYVAEELNKKVENGQELPEKIEESDNLYLIQDNASTTSNEYLLKMWAKLYTEEACKPGSVSKRAIKLVETLDIKIVKILEEEIFPYCDENGFFWGDKDDITNIILCQDYNLIENNFICSFSKNPTSSYSAKINNLIKIYCYPGFGYSANYNSSMYRLTNAGLEIYQNIYSQKVDIGTKEIVFKNIDKASENWSRIWEKKGVVKYLNNIKPEEKYILCDENGLVVYPEHSPYRTLQDFLEISIRNIEVINNDK